ncbi:MAG: polysaccharide deacetylase family protein [Gemmatimonadetes bacterium]|nr:polysaccharide deacetylase family protein [Gemmatimonadota bacterium]
MNRLGVLATALLGPAKPVRVFFTVDLEQDCPPFLDTYRGVEEGLPRLLELLACEAVGATFFTTGEVARRYPGAVRALLGCGHELGCHGLTHRSFACMDRATARDEVRTASAILREFTAVASFRAPYLALPEAFLDLLEEAGYGVDCSQAKYKPSYYGPKRPTSLSRVAASITSSALRLPRWLREPWLRALRSPIILFVHPWELVDLRGARLRLDCRFNTGEVALDRIRSVIRFFKERGATFGRIGELACPRRMAA